MAYVLIMIILGTTGPLSSSSGAEFINQQRCEAAAAQVSAYGVKTFCVLK